MNPHEIFEKIPELEKNFSDFQKQRKQMIALQNHSEVKPFQETERKVFSAITYCMKGSFLQDEDATWISRKLDRLQISYLDWAHRTQWLKAQILAKKPPAKPSPVQSTIFDYLPQTPSISLHLLSASQRAKLAARAG